MSDITGNAFTVRAAETLEKAIESLGATAAKTQVGKAVAVTSEGAVMAGAGDEATFIGIVKAASGEAQATFAVSKMVNEPVDGSNPTYAPYYEGHVTIPEGKRFTVERNQISYVLLSSANGVEFGDCLKLADDGKFQKAGDGDDIVGRVYGTPDSNNVVRAYLRAL